MVRTTPLDLERWVQVFADPFDRPNKLRQPLQSVEFALKRYQDRVRGHQSV